MTGPLRISAHPGYDYRDDPHDQRGAHGLTLTFTLVSEDERRFACSLEVMTGWMARPLVGDRMARGEVQRRRHSPGTDSERRHDPLPVVYLCVPESAPAPDWYSGNGKPCPYLGEPCVGDVGYVIGDEALTVLIRDGEAALAEWLADTAASWLRSAQEDDIETEPAQ